MINNEAYLKTSVEVCTQIASDFDIVDNCIAMSDTNKQYTINPQTSYSPSPHIPQGSYTSVIISPNTNNTADLYNGFIKADMEVNIGMKGDGLKYLTSDNYDFDRPDIKLRNSLNKFVKYDLSNITTEFVPLGEKVKLWSSIATTDDDGYTVKWDERIFYVNSYETTDCQSIVPYFGIDARIYNGLVQRYSDPSHPLTFPTQTISVYTTTNKLTQTIDKSTITITPRFVDSIFCLFPLKHTHRTIFKNPLFTSFQLNCRSYGNIPAKPFGTDGNSLEFIEYYQNAMNMNGEQSGFNKEVIASLINTK
ncbi:hypothetical protein M9Y10_013367 [Tritrichomonas musculus]|uniref:Uncharacterized protein n=1 Tax=Tritrichomonas musculus TaxID=1915356 RepID=A0ABR2I712_9EUKA